MAAFKQQKAMENKTTTHNNTTHNLKENFKFFDIQPATNLNKTMDIIGIDFWNSFDFFF